MDKTVDKSEGMLVAPSEERLLVITDPQRDRYATMRLIEWWDQERIQAAHVMVVGAGALGNEVLKNLALLGVGHLFIVDFDTVEAANLTRSVLFRPQDGGRSKAEVAAERVGAINPDVQAIPFSSDVTRDLGLGLYRRMDVVIGCLDNRAARMAVNQACWHMTRPWVDGALDVMDGLVRVFIPPLGACYECTMTEQDYALVNLRYSCPPGFTFTVGRQPTTPMAASIIGAMQVQEAVKLLHRLPVRGGEGIYYSGATARLTRVAYPTREECPAHHIYEPIVGLPYGVADLTIGQFLELAQAHLGAAPTLFLSQKVVTSFYCAACGQEEVIYRPYEAVIPDRVPCPRCGALRTYDAISSLTARERPLDVPLAQLGVPPLDVLPVRTSNGWGYFELSADESRVLPI
jgi:adenylyltransferase/sulfurtransferase